MLWSKPTQLMDPGLFWCIFSFGRKGAGGGFRKAVPFVPACLGMEGSLSLRRGNFLFHTFSAYKVARNIKEEWNITIWSQIYPPDLNQLVSQDAVCLVFSMKNIQKKLNIFRTEFLGLGHWLAISTGAFVKPPGMPWALEAFLPLRQSYFPTWN